MTLSQGPAIQTLQTDVPCEAVSGAAISTTTDT